MEGDIILDLKRIGLIGLASYFIFRFYFSFISTSVQQLVLFGFIGVYVVFHFFDLVKYFMNLGRNKILVLFSIILYALVVSFSFVIPLIYKTNDFSYFVSQLRYVSYTLSFIVLVHMIQTHLKPTNLKDEVVGIYVTVCRNYVLVSIAMLLLPTLKFFWQSIIHETERNIYLVNTNASYVARWGWAGYSGFAITLQMTVAVAFVLYLMLKELNSNGNIPLKHIVNLALLVIGNAFYGRVGLLTSLFLIGCAIIYLVFSKGKILLGAGIIGSFLVMFLALTLLKEVIPAIESWYNWAIGPIVDLFQTGTIQTSSTDVLLDMYFIPDWHTLLFGDGQYVDNATGGYYMAVDVGYLRPTLFYGIFLLIGGYLIPIILTYTLLRLDKNNRALMIFLLLAMFIFEIKGEVYMTIIPIAFMLFAAETISAYEWADARSLEQPKQDYLEEVGT